MDEWYVRIVKSDTDEVVKEMGPMSSTRADRVEDGANINLDHDNYHTEQSEISSVWWNQNGNA